jgi:hypothetical protein
MLLRASREAYDLLLLLIGLVFKRCSYSGHPVGMREGSQGQAKRSPWNRPPPKNPRPEGTRDVTR